MVDPSLPIRVSGADTIHELRGASSDMIPLLGSSEFAQIRAERDMIVKLPPAPVKCRE